MTIIPDRHGSGTNALVLTPPDVIEPAFGPDSRERHEQAAAAAGATCEVVELETLAVDVDTVDDLEALRRALAERRGGAAHTRGMLSRLAGRERPPATLRGGRPLVISAVALPGIPEVRAGDDLAALLSQAAGPFAEGDLLVVAHKIVSKAEGRTVSLADVVPGDRAVALAAEHGKDARVIEVILGESAAIVRSRPGVLICRTHHGFVCANAGVDASNAGRGARPPAIRSRRLGARIAQRLRERGGVAPAIVVADSFGRAWRVGQCDVAIGIAGIAAVDDWRGRRDAAGRMLDATIVAIADEAAAAADLARRKDSREPAVLVRGLERHVSEADGAGASALVRARAEDLFR